MSASVVQICNLALLNFGEVTITSLTEDSKQARACNVFYPLLREQLLYAFPWNFAMLRADISAQRTDTPSFGFDYAYSLPTNPRCLRVWELYDYTGNWTVENNVLLTDKEEEVYIRFIQDITEAGRFDSYFVKCLGLLLSAHLAAKLAPNNKNMRAQLLKEFDDATAEAYLLNALEGRKPKEDEEQPLDSGKFTWQTEGR